MRRTWVFLALVLCLALGRGRASAEQQGSNSLIWHAKENRVDANIDHSSMPAVLKKIARATGWKVYVEPGVDEPVSVRFKDLPQDEALRRLLGKYNFAKDKTNGVSRLLVFRTTATAATQAVRAEKKDYRIHNEDLVRLKSGAGTNAIDKLAAKLGAKVTGRNDKIGLYRLQFADGASADAALQALASDPSVAAADGNYSVDRPTPAQMTPVNFSPSTPYGFALNPTPDANGPVLGLVDTGVDPPSQFKPYMLTPIDVTGETDEPTPGEPSHGTMMLETMLDAMGADPSRVLPVDIYGSAQSTSTFELISGVVSAINAGANPISMSLGGTGDSQLLESLIQEGVQKGIVFVAAAGNTPGEGDVYPANYPGVIGVTASTQTVSGPITSGNPAGGQPQLASYANDTPSTSIIAPGTSIVEAVNGQTWEVEGTSPATAATSATIAYLVNQDHMTLQQATSQVVKVAPAPPVR